MILNAKARLQAATPILYHKTGLAGALGIFKSNKFQLSIALPGSVETNYQGSGYDYFLSLTRSKVGNYHAAYLGYGGEGVVGAVMFVLDGNKLAANYKVVPIDYWGQEMTLLSEGREAEDRLLSSKAAIPAYQYVKEVHIYLGNKPGERSYCKSVVLEAFHFCSKVYLYDEPKYWVLQTKSKAVSPSVLQDEESYVEPERTRRSYNYLDPWLELIQNSSRHSLSEKATKLLYDLQFYSAGMTSSLADNMHNLKRPGESERESVIFITDFMRKNKLANLKMLMNFLKSKWEKP